MSTFKVVLHGEKTLKTTNQKNLSKSQKFAIFVIVKPLFFSVRSNFTYDSEVYDLMKLYLETLHSVFGRTTVVELFRGKVMNLS